MNFRTFRDAVAKQFTTLASGNNQLYRVGVGKDALWETYLSSFPDGSNPMYKERTEHDCNCCKQFIRAVGDVVGIIDGKIVSIWDISIASEPEYQIVADKMKALVEGGTISDVFLHYERTAGHQQSNVFDDSTTTTFFHFFVNIPERFVKPGASIASSLAPERQAQESLSRALETISLDSIDGVLDLIAQNSLYRGEEHKFVLTEFRKVKVKYNKIGCNGNTFLWANSQSLPSSVSHIRNSVIGTLLVDMSEGVDLEVAVKAFESKVAPANYKRTKALVTPKMLQQAKEKIESLGLMSALNRRHATLDDITINNVLFADRSTRLVSEVDDLFSSACSVKPKLDRVEEVSIEKFISEILPRTQQLEVFFEGSQTGNLMSLVAPQDPSAGRLFKWDNGFSWSYNGEMADSMKQRVKDAGGKVEGDLCCRLAWNNYDDLDFYMEEPNGGKIFFCDKISSYTGGHLDVDMNAGSGITRTPVENIVYKDSSRMKEGKYNLSVNQYFRRESIDNTFDVEIDVGGVVHHFSGTNPSTGTSIKIAEITYSKKTGISVKPLIKSSTSTKEVWGVNTNQFHKVSSVMLSPNYWDGQVGIGNKHYFFMMDGCISDALTRGFYNEFLREELTPHRKAFECVGSKVSFTSAGSQLSGLGFSSTSKAAILLRVTGATKRLVKVVF